ncbi:MAG: hypothetical protein SH848_05390 [Saprospiraceae bacterium]|nr:hypothetical protein [Saprospiraceae bacterium]
MFGYTRRRLSDVILQLPVRLRRLALHVADPKGRSDVAYAAFPRWMSGAFWLLELLLLLLEIAGFPEFYELLAAVFKFRTRKLTEQEIRLAKSIFGDTLQYEYIRVDESAYIGPRQSRFCYVSFYTLNSWGQIYPALLIHELTHVWQYQHLGIRYIPRALAAQRTASGYNYGGEPALEQAIASGKSLAFFNLEQQADLVEDYYRLQNGLPAQWNRNAAPQLSLYEFLLTGIINR